MAEVQPVDLTAERRRVESFWRLEQHPSVPLAAAAAFTFHQVRENSPAVASAEGYAAALNIAAAALSRLIPVYGFEDPKGERTRLRIDLTKHRFVNGAAELKSSDGKQIARLSVERQDVVTAIAFMKRTGFSVEAMLLSEGGAFRPSRANTPPGRDRQV